MNCAGRGRTQADHRPRRPIRSDVRHDSRRTLYDSCSAAASTHVNPETEATVRAVDYRVVGATGPDQFRVYSDDDRDVAH